MKRKILLFLMIAMFSVMTFAADDVNSVGAYLDSTNYYQRALNDLYFGFNFGYDNASFKRQSHYKNENVNYHAASIVGSLDVGYGRRILDELYLGAEITGHYDKAHHVGYDGLAYYKIQIKHSFTFDIIPGAFVTKDFLIYGRVGLAEGKIKLTTNDVNILYTPQFSKTRSGYVLGGGVRYYFLRNFSINADYAFTKYHTIKTMYHSVLNGWIDRRYTVSTNVVSVGIAIHINNF